jgi:hypothetical protein
MQLPPDILARARLLTSSPTPGTTVTDGGAIPSPGGGARIRLWMVTAAGFRTMGATAVWFGEIQSPAPTGRFGFAVQRQGGIFTSVVIPGGLVMPANSEVAIAYSSDAASQVCYVTLFYTVELWS